MPNKSAETEDVGFLGTRCRGETRSDRNVEALHQPKECRPVIGASLPHSSLSSSGVSASEVSCFGRLLVKNKNTTKTTINTTSPTIAVLLQRNVVTPGRPTANSVEPDLHYLTRDERRGSQSSDWVTITQLRGR